jgi:membrane fusion protein, multidrug efflux system
VVVRAPLRLAAVALLIPALVACSRGKNAQPAGQPQTIPVTVAPVVRKDVPVAVRAIGNVLPSETVTVRARVGGILAQGMFREGQDVREGDPLFKLDSKPLEAELMQAQANLARSRAQFDNARKDAERYSELYRLGFVAQAQYEQTRTNAVALEATVRADRAVVENARLQLGYASVRAPISGRTGALQVHEGELIQPNNTPLVVINQLRPISIAFALPQQQLPEIRRYKEQGTLQTQAVEPTTGRPLANGDLAFIDNRLDPATGTIALKATFANADAALWPGQFVNVVLTLSVEKDAVVVPPAAVQAGQEGRYVFVVKPDGTAEQRPVTVAHQTGGEIVIAQGVAPGDTVVTDGQLRLFPGARVETRVASSATPAAASLPPPSASPRTQ